MKPLFTIVFCTLFLSLLSAQYRITGQLNLTDEWQPKVYLAAINKLSDYYRTSPDMIVSTAEVASDGSFELRGDNLPDDERFYRLYLMKTQNTDYDACLYVGGDDHNFAHLILKNDDELHIVTDTIADAPFGNYEVIGSKPNQLMRTLASIVYPSFYFYRIKFPTELKFSEDRLHTNLLQFADTCSHPLVALAAVNNTDFDEYFDKDKAFYQAFGQRLKKDVPLSIYNSNYQLKCRYYANEESDVVLPGWVMPALLFLGLLAISGWWQFARLYGSRKMVAQKRLELEENLATSLAKKQSELTPKEAEIFEMIAKGLSNKEIASALFIELSTVKTHINKLYGKLGVNNRREAQILAKKQGNKGD